MNCHSKPAEFLECPISLTPGITLSSRLEAELDEAESKAWDSLSRYKFQMFGYWAAIWVHLNRIGEFKRPNPWSKLVATAKVAKTPRPDCELLESPFSAITQCEEEPCI